MRFFHTVILSVMLSGCVPAAIVGGGAVVSTMAMRTKGISGTLDDASISAKVRNNLLTYDQKWGTKLADKVGIAVQNGEVLMTGHVATQEEAMWAEQVVWEIFGVKQVNNHLTVQQALTWKDTCKDSWITTRVKAALIANKKINFRSLNYAIKTVGGVVYVMGIARSRPELNAVLETISHTKGVKKVVSLARFKEEIY